ncbi:MAG: hypothetical protein C5B59_14700 [Bacteroidetes bacterium]|nr:MAG: hypothetical protein C5B59_14700 [Bacteroidota bacterium]
MKRFRTIWTLFLILCGLVSCNVTRTLMPGEYLYTGGKVNVNAPRRLVGYSQRDLRNQLSDLLRPRPNSRILGFPFKLWVYNVAGQPTGRGLRYWLKNKVGEPPVIASFPVFEKNRAVLENRLDNRGFFRATVKLDTVSKGRTMRAIYTAETGAQYTIRNITFPADSTEINKAIQALVKRSLLKPGDPYDLDVIRNERSRIDSRLKQKGFYFFSPDFLLALVDSTVGDNKVDIRMVVKRSTPHMALETYRINDVIVFADFSSRIDTNAAIRSAKKFEGFTIIDPQERFNPFIFTHALMFKPGDIYNRRAHDMSLNRLINLGVFKFVKVRFDQVDSLHNMLNAYYYLTPTEKKSLRFQVSGLTKSDDANGGLLSVTWRNRSIFRGAELFTSSVYGGLEWQFVSKGQRVQTSKIGIDNNLYIPRIVGPFNIKGSSAFVPKTRINLGYEYFKRSSQYTLNSAKTSFGYIWKENATNEHQLSILSINLVNPSNISPEFQAQLDTNITLARSIERQFIIGPIYNFNLNTQLRPGRRRNNFYFNANVDLSSNLIGLITGADINRGNVKTIFNTPFSQYVRGEVDFRHYLTLGSPTTVWVNRITGGVGYAYGNSNVMPFIKEFFAGGANDLRAFRARSIGPGTFYGGNRDTAFLPDQPGDVKILLNSELRFKLFSVFRWAFFVDAGNVWTVREDTSRPGSQFNSQFLREMGMGVGTGLRLDFTIIIIRLDLAVPIREPYLPAGQRWVFDTRNKVWNFAIGYPF